MREMKDSGIPWVGQIPDDWIIKRGKFVLKLLNRPVLDTDEVITCFRDGEVTLRRNRREDGFTVSLKEIGYQGLEPGDLVIHGMDGFAGSIGISDSRGKASPVLVVCDSDENKRYIMYYLRAMAYNDVFAALATGIRVRSCDLRWNKLSELPYILPSIQEQEQVVEAIESCTQNVNSLIANVQTQIEKLKAYKQSVITEVVTKGLDPTVPMKDSGVDRLDRIPMHWRIMKQTMLTTRIGDGLHGTPEFDDSSNIFFINGNNLGEKYITVRENTKSVLPSEYEKYRLDLNDRTLLISLNGTIGSISRYNGEIVVFGKSAGYIIVKNNINIDYLSYYLQTRCVKEIFELSFAGTTINNLSLETLRNLRVCVPPHEEQEAIVVYLDEKCSQIDRLIAIKQSKIEKLEQYKRSLIYEYVTGKKEVC